MSPSEAVLKLADEVLPGDWDPIDEHDIITEGDFWVKRMEPPFAAASSVGLELHDYFRDHLLSGTRCWVFRRCNGNRPNRCKLKRLINQEFSSPLPLP